MRRYFTFISLLALASILYLGWAYYSRQKTNRAMLKRIEESKSSKRREIPEVYQEGRLIILGFYASPGVIQRGEKVKICYSVLNSERVRIEPPIGEVWPSLSRCIDVTPQKNTTYRLIAEDAEGNKKTAEFTIKVH